MMSNSSKNYLDQYSRTKNMHEIHKSRNSYKQLLQNSKTRQNSTTTVHLKLSSQKKAHVQVLNSFQHHFQDTKDTQDKLFTNSIVKDKDQLEANAINNNVGSSQTHPLLCSTQNMQNIINVSYGKLNSKMKLKVNATTDKSLRSMSSHQQLLRQQNSLAVSSMANIGVGLSSNKKKAKLVTLTSQAIVSSKKAKTFGQASVLQQQKSRSISQSHNNSILNSKYSTSIAHEAAYRSIKKQIEESTDQTKDYHNNNFDHNHNQSQHRNPNPRRDSFGGRSIQGGEKTVQVVTLNSSMLRSRDGRVENNGFEQLYDRVRDILSEHRQRQQEWDQQRKFYKQRIRYLEQNLEQQNKQNKHSHTLSIQQELSKQKQKQKSKSKQKSKQKQKYMHPSYHASNYNSHVNNGHANHSFNRVVHN